MKVFTKETFIVLAVVAVAVGVGIVYLGKLFPPILDKKATEKDFLKNRDNIMVVTSYLAKSKYDNIYITDNMDSGIMFANVYGDIAISDLRIIDAINILFKKGYSVITKDGNTIHFQRSTRLKDFGSGIAYSIDGSEPELQFLTKLEPLTAANWYYYEEDFNEYKRRE